MGLLDRIFGGEEESCDEHEWETYWTWVSVYNPVRTIVGLHFHTYQEDEIVTPFERRKVKRCVVCDEYLVEEMEEVDVKLGSVLEEN